MVDVMMVARSIARSFAGVCPEPLTDATGAASRVPGTVRLGGVGSGWATLRQTGAPRCGFVHKTTAAGGRADDPSSPARPCDGAPSVCRLGQAPQGGLQRVATH